MNQEAAAARARVDDLADEIAICAAHIDAALHTLLTHIRRFDALKGWSKQGSKSCAHWLSWRIGLGLVAAREKVRVAAALGSLPLIDAALARGELSYAKVRAMTRVATDYNEDLLLAQAQGLTGAELERVCAGFRKLAPGPLDEDRRYVRRRTMPDGMVQIEMRLLPDEAERVWQALSETRRRLRAESVGSGQNGSHAAEGAPAEAPSGRPDPTKPGAAAIADLADAAVAMAETSLATGAAAGTAAADRRTLLVHLSERRVAAVDAGFASDVGSASAWSAELQDGTTLCGSTLLRLACDSGLVVARTDGARNVLDIGRRRRTVPPALTRALRLRDRGCRFPGCGHAVFVDAHHIQHWAHGGRTALGNLVLVCHAHHVALHEGGFAVRCADDGALRFLDPDGLPIPATPPRPPVAANALATLVDQQVSRGIRIDRRTSLPRRSFLSPDFDGCVRALAWRQARAATHAME